jgi:hypothetical protein
MKMTSRLLAAVALAAVSGSALAQLPITMNSCDYSVDALRQGVHGAQDTSADGVFWPPNHKMRTVTISAENDNEKPCNVTITSVTQDEPVTGPGAGSGQTSPDAANCSNAGNDSRVDLRGERSGMGTGRYYKIDFTMDDPDAPGQPKAAQAKALVPHDQGVVHVGTYVDEGPLYQSAGGPISCSE